MSVMLANGGSKDRRELDFYPTPPNVTEALMNFLLTQGYELNKLSCLEPACGSGEMSMVLQKYFKFVISSDIRDTGFGKKNTNYLIDENKKCDCLITNPPFSESQKFIEKALSEKHFIIAILCKSQYWHSKRRRDLFIKNLPAYILPLTWRPDFYFGAKSGSPTMEVLWTVWVYNINKSMYYPLEKPS